MSSSLKPIKAYGKAGPNPPKVLMVLEELGLPYEIVDVPFSDVKGPAYIAVNPNGRLPAIQDPNTGLTLWESGAILEYLVEKYDTKNLISFPAGSSEAYLAKQWLFFQVTGQGPYFGQAVWFTKFHSEQLPSAKERYYKEVARVTGVLEGVLAENKKKNSSGDGPWLVGNKCSYADISFIMWQRVIEMMQVVPKEHYDIEKYPEVKAWMEKMTSRKAIKKILDVPQGH